MTTEKPMDEEILGEMVDDTHRILQMWRLTDDSYLNKCCECEGPAPASEKGSFHVTYAEGEGARSFAFCERHSPKDSGAFYKWLHDGRTKHFWLVDAIEYDNFEFMDELCANYYFNVLNYRGTDWAGIRPLKWTLRHRADGTILPDNVSKKDLILYVKCVEVGGRKTLRTVFALFPYKLEDPINFATNASAEKEIMEALFAGDTVAVLDPNGLYEYRSVLAKVKAGSTIH